MERKRYEDPSEARQVLPAELSTPEVLERDNGLPFERLTGDEFEVFCYLLVFEERQDSSVVLYGKTADRGRDIVERNRDDECEIIQCKNYRGTLGIGAVRETLIKLVAHLYEGNIHQDPDKVTFYVGQDLTSPAIDLIDSRDLWRECVEGELEKFLGEKPEQELVDFAREWWVEIEHQNRHDLTRRAESCPHLIEQFFARQKVITGDASEISSELADIKERLNDIHFLVHPEPKNQSPSLTGLLQQAEAANPGLSVSATSSTEGTVFQISPKPGTEKVPLGKLKFPPTEAGKRGSRKFQQVIEEGRGMTLEPGEFTWTTHLKAPLPEGESEEHSKLVLEPSLPERQVPVKLSAGGSSEPISVVDFAELCFVRVGTREIELEVGGGQLAASFNVTLSLSESRAVGANFTLRPAEFPARAAMKTLQFFRTAMLDGQMRISSLEFDAPLFDASEVSLDLDVQALENSIEFLAWLISINERFGLELRYPEEISEEDERTVELAAIAIQDGRVAEPAEGPFAIDADKEHATMMIEGWDEHGSGAIRVETDSTYQFQGTRLPLGPEKLVIENAVPQEPLSALKRKLDEIPEDGILRICFTGERVVHVFTELLD